VAWCTIDMCIVRQDCFWQATCWMCCWLSIITGWYWCAGIRQAYRSPTVSKAPLLRVVCTKCF
jgi:hypothetical protein